MYLVNRVFSRPGTSVEVGGADGGAGPVACPALQVANAVEEFGAALADRAGEGPVVGAGVALGGDGDLREVVFVGLAQPDRLAALAPYKSRTGTVTIPRGHTETIVIDGQEHSVKLGVFLSNTKARRAKLAAAKLSALAALGLDWAA